MAPTTRDLTRWNRAGLARFRYTDGNAAVYLDLLRGLLSERFPDWTAMQGGPIPGETEAECLSRLLAAYAAKPGDPLAALIRTFVRATHVLGETIDACANEHYIGTATQWEHVRRLVAMLDYHPRPPASAYTTLVLTAKEKLAGTVAAGFAVKNAPTDGGAPLVFETLEDIDVDAALNALRPSEWNRSPAALGGTTLTLSGEIKGLRTGEPIVLEDERTGTLQAHVLQGISAGEGATTIAISPAMTAGFVAGYTLIHLAPQDHLTPIAPAAKGAHVGRGLALDGSSSDLVAGEVLIVSVPGHKPLYRRVRYVEESRVVFTEDVGELAIASAQVSRPFELAVAQQGSRWVHDDGSILGTVYAAGDWTRLIGTWAAHERYVQGNRRLPVYQVLAVKYVPTGIDPASLESDDKPGFSAITLRWNAAEDGVDTSADLSLSNPQSLLVPPVSPGPWRADRHLEKSRAGRLPLTITTSQPKKTTAGDLAVITRGGDVAWARLAAVEVDLEHTRAGLRAVSGWSDRGGSPFHLSRTTVHAHFKTQARLVGWDTNTTPLTGVTVPLDSLPSSLVKGRVVIVTTPTAARKTTVALVDPTSSPPTIHLADTLPAGATLGTLVIAANVVSAGHGETVPTRVLGSGDGTRSSPSFTIEVAGVSFVADAEAENGVRAAVTVQIDGRTWAQVDRLADAGPTDAAYTARMTEDGHLKLDFGDGTNGRRLPTGVNNVRATYRRGVGATGNLAAKSLLKPARPHRLLDAVAQPIAASGGADMEDASAIRTSAPATLLTLGRAVSLSDFALLVRSHSSVAQAAAFSKPSGRGRSDNVEVVVIPAGGAAFTSELGATLQVFAETGAGPGVAVLVRAYEPVIVSLRVNLRIDPEEYDTEVVRASVVSALEQAFSIAARKLGDALYVAAAYRVVEAVTGVMSSDCAIDFDATTGVFVRPPLEVRGEDGTLRALQPTARQCVHLDPSAPVIDVTVEEVTA